MRTTEACFECYGTGQTAHYSACDFEGPKECSTCKGSGRIPLRDDKGRFAKLTPAPKETDR